MSIYRCNQCGTIAETTQTHNTTAICAKCQNNVQVYDTVFYIQALLKQYFAVSKELKALKENNANIVEKNESVKQSQQVAKTHNPQQNQAQTSKTTNKKPVQAALNNTDFFANKQQHDEIKKYLDSKNIVATFDYSAVDMSGYFDESAELIGENFSLLEKHLKTLRYLYSNNKQTLTIDCINLPQQQTQKLQKIFKQLFEYTMFAKYIYHSNDKKIRLTLNMAEPVKKFFLGSWLEWFALIKLLKETHAQGKKFSIARSVIIQHSNGDKHEFDIVFKPENKMPIFIECKSGEFRQHLDKFIRICKKINIPTKNWLVLAAEIDKAQADAFEKMYPVRFCDLNHFVEKVKPLI